MITLAIIARALYAGQRKVQKLQRKRKTRVVGVAELGTDVPPRQTSSEIWRCAKFSDVDEESTQLRKTTSEPDCLDLVMPFEPFPEIKRDFPRFPAEDNSNNLNHNNNRVRTVLDTDGCHSNGCHNNSCHGHHGRNNSCHVHHHGPARVINVRSAWTEEVVAARDVETTVVRSIPDNRVMITR